ncbi:hypothetical protein [Arthrobacter sp. USHLN218]|uniref:hypothetical protein n=1 Tax=Arthrobacter sp. USHLN218 TaxID=3081232 RepID=UPI00301B648F
MGDGRVPEGCAGLVGGPEPDGQAAAAILARLEALDPYSARDAAGEEIEPGSPLASMDRHFAASRSVSSLLRQSLAAAMDNLQALRRLLFVEDGSGGVFYRLNSHAPYSLVRTVIECGTTVLWALQPEEGRERIRRSLVLVARDVFNAASFWDAYLEELRPELHPEAQASFEGLRHEVNEAARAAGLPPIFTRKAEGRWGYATKNRTQTAILKDLRADGGVPAELIYIWQFCSGYSHGLEWATGKPGSYPGPFSGQGGGPARTGAKDGRPDRILAGSGNEREAAAGMEQLRRASDAACDLIPRAWELYDLRRRVWPLL